MKKRGIIQYYPVFVVLWGTLVAFSCSGESSEDPEKMVLWGTLVAFSCSGESSEDPEKTASKRVIEIGTPTWTELNPETAPSAWAMGAMLGIMSLVPGAVLLRRRRRT